MANATSMDGGGEIRETRRALGLSQSEFGRLLGVTAATVCRYERGNYLTPTLLLAVRQLRAQQVVANAAKGKRARAA